MAVKLKKIVIKHIKNVGYGHINLVDKNGGYLNVLGIYGQNGSGKTTVVDAMQIIRDLIQGKSIPSRYAGIFNTTSDTKEYPTIMLEIEEEGNYTLRYEVQFAENTFSDIPKIIVGKEKILYKRNKPKERFKFAFDFSILEDFESRNRIEGNLKSRTKLVGKEVLRFMASASMEESRSYLFSNQFKERVQEEGSEPEKEVIRILEEFTDNFRIYTQREANLSGLGAMPTSINYTTDRGGVRGVIPIVLNPDGAQIKHETAIAYEGTISYMNEILPAIIPDLTLRIETRESSIDQNGEKYDIVRFYADRNGKVFSLIHESEGIKKIISLISILVEVYNNPNVIAFIDEFDSSLFEYLLGELVEVLSIGAQGQLIFTSHNLRVLEMLPTNKIRFSTTNPNNRYITMKGIKATNNLRDVYIRSILLGGAEEELYEGENQSKIRRSLRKAGKHIGK